MCMITKYCFLKVEGCEKTYTHPSSLKKHLKVHQSHGDLNSSSPAEVPGVKRSLKQTKQNSKSSVVTVSTIDLSTPITSYYRDTRPVEIFTQRRAISRSSPACFSVNNSISSFYSENHETLLHSNMNFSQYPISNRTASNYCDIVYLNENPSGPNQCHWTNDPCYNLHEAQWQQQSYCRASHFGTSTEKSNHFYYYQPCQHRFEQDNSHLSGTSFTIPPQNMSSYIDYSQLSMRDVYGHINYSSF